MAYSIQQISFTQSVIGAIAIALVIGCTILHMIEEREDQDLQIRRQLLCEGAKELARNHEQRKQEVLNNIRLRQEVDEDRRNRIFLRSHIHAIFSCVRYCQQPCGCRYTDRPRVRDLDVEFLHACYSDKPSGFVSDQDCDTTSTSSNSTRSTTSVASGTVTPATPVSPITSLAATPPVLPENRYDSSLSFLHDYFANELN
ncbi:hypothetical protein MCOR25_003024 [Pyricularia grisea]|uniref:Uncharacterized protein n=1 Tax=Pyricularia grisea TaxID=148305 RepID=A0A6P8B7H1_PYRGI|nr:hypothetical protein PgNI_05336 [Pyricularia grisea]KAI6375130.1 hypothetical protein MCOR25_003024 [Pyricularia grisea]TLD11220.1 hypothetical protein PgNI_05336 [Pyricularia grisea]